MKTINLKLLLRAAVILAVGIGLIWFSGNGTGERAETVIGADVTAVGGETSPIAVTASEFPDLVKVNADEALLKPNPLGEIVMGDPSAPVTVIEYASLTCGHCGAFHNEVLPEIKRDYVDKGLVKFHFRPFPFDGVATAGAMLVQCVAPGARLTFLDLLFKRQMALVQSEYPFGQLQIFAKQAGLPEAKFMACLQSQDKLDAIRDMQAIAGGELGVNSTPTFFINGDKVTGNVGIESFRKILDEKLEAQGI